MRNAVDFKYYDITAEDHSAHRDPRPIESLEDVIPAIEFYNGPARGSRKKPINYKHVREMWLDMQAEVSQIPYSLLDPNNYDQLLSHPAPPHYPRLSQPDRQIFESCAVAGSKILWPHPETSGMQKHLTAQYILIRAKCTLQEAEYIADSCVSLEATKKMVDTFCKWGKKKSAKELIAYLWKFVIGVTEAEAPSDEKEPWEDEPVVAGKPLWKNSIDKVRGYNGICEDVEIDEIEIKPKEPGLAKIINNKILWPSSKLDFLPSTIPPEDLTVIDMSEYKEPESETAPSTIAYHVLEDFNADEEIPWIDRQPEWFVQKLNTIQACKTIADLAKLGKDIHGSNNFNRDQAGVFWTEYNSRKHKLAPKHLSLTARSLLKKIVQSNGHIGALGVFLHNVQSGKIKVTPYPSKHEFGIIWKTYKRRKEVHTTA